MSDCPVSDCAVTKKAWVPLQRRCYNSLYLVFLVLGFAASVDLTAACCVLCLHTHWLRGVQQRIAQDQQHLAHADLNAIQQFWTMGPALKITLPGCSFWILRDEVDAATWAQIHRQIRIALRRAAPG